MESIKLSAHDQLQTNRFHKALLAVSLAGITVMASIGMPQLRLVGTNPGQVGSPFAIIENTENGSQDIFELDRPVFGDAQLVSIDANTVTLMVKDELVTLKLASSGKQKHSQADIYSNLEVSRASNEIFSVSPENSLVQNVAQAEDGSSIVVLSQEMVNKNFTDQGNLSDAVARTNPEPVIENGHMVGVKLSSIEDNGILSQIGLQSGDVVNKINGVQVLSLSQAVEIAESSNWNDIELTRNGEAVKVGVSVASNQ